ncbi:MAG: membrane lipoprotein lipid attachment site-containing protein [Cytophagales bacterium]
MKKIILGFVITLLVTGCCKETDKSYQFPNTLTLIYPETIDESSDTILFYKGLNRPNWIEAKYNQSNTVEGSYYYGTTQSMRLDLPLREIANEVTFLILYKSKIDTLTLSYQPNSEIRSRCREEYVFTKYSNINIKNTTLDTLKIERHENYSSSSLSINAQLH